MHNGFLQWARGYAPREAVAERSLLFEATLSSPQNIKRKSGTGFTPYHSFVSTSKNFMSVGLKRLERSVFQAYGVRPAGVRQARLHVMQIEGAFNLFAFRIEAGDA